jgi:uncharacterized protein (TIGR02597 family)
MWMSAASLVATHAADVYTPVVGFLKFDCLPASDTIVSVPFHPTPRWSGALSAAPTNPSGGIMRLALKSSPNFAGSELTDTPHFVYLRDDTGTNGRHFLVSAHGSDTIDVNATPAELTGLTTNSQIAVIPGWTLATLFPPASRTTFHASTGNLASTRKSELLFFDRDTVGSNLAPSRTFFVSDIGWTEAGTFADAGNVIIEPGQAFIVRHPDNVAQTTFVPSQQVYGGAFAVSLPYSTSSARDTMLALPRPVPLTLDQLDLGGAFEDSPSTASNARRDELLVYTNATAVRNRLPLAVYFRTGGSWVADANGFPASGSVSIEPSAGLVIRKAQAGADGAPLVWINNPVYDVNAP